MTHSGGKPHQVGDRGQRYEVTFFDPDANRRRVLGWSPTAEGAQQMASAVESHPAWQSPEIRDRQRVRIFCDMDGVLADFDAHHEAVFGVRADKLLDNVDWAAVRAVPDFYLNIPPMPDMRALWARIEPHRPIILTGVPASVAEAPDNKRAWAHRHIGEHVQVRCCPSKDKCLHAEPGDILIDDWEKYRHLWEAAGGIFLTHRSAAETIAELDRLGI